MRRVRCGTVAILTLVTLPGLALCQTFTWNAPGFGLWNNNSSWLPNTGFPNANTHQALFNDAGGGALVNIGASVTVNRLTFDAITGPTAYSLSGSSITLGGGSARIETLATVTSTGEQAVTVDVLGTGNVVHGGGTLFLGGANSTFSGTVTANAGRLRIAPTTSADRPLGNVANGVNITNGGQLFVSAAGAGGMTVPYALTITGAGPGGAPVNETGALVFGPLSQISWTGAITLGGNATIRWGGISGLAGGVSLGANTLTFVSVPGDTGGIFTNGISGTGNVIFQGHTQIGVNSTYSGTSTIDGRTVTLVGVPNGLGPALGTQANKVTIINNGLLRMQSAPTFTVGNKLLTLSGGTLAATGTVASWAGAIDLTADSQLRAEGTATLTVTGGISNPNSLITLNATESTSRINVNTVGISGNGTVTTAGDAGQIHLNASSNYTGQTTVPTAHLYANGTSATGTGPVVVNGAGVLRGTGSITGTVAVNGTGTLAPGAVSTAGLLQVDNAVTIATGADFRIRLFSGALGDHDTLGMTAGAFSFNNADLVLDVSNFTGTVPNDAIIELVAAFASATVTPGHTFAGLPEGALATNAGGTDLFIHYVYGTDGTIYLSTSAAIPEPTVLGMIGLTLALVSYGVGRRKKAQTQDVTVEVKETVAVQPAE